MPSPQTLPSENATSFPTAVVPNGISHTDRNGDTPSALPNGLQRAKDDRGAAAEETLQAQKQLAKAQMSSSDPPIENQQASDPSLGANGSPNAPTPVLNGTIQTRKRSRSGTRISRSLDSNGINIHRGLIDPDGMEIESVKKIQYLERDHLHMSAALHDEENGRKTNEWKVAELGLHSKTLRGQSVELPKSEKELRKRQAMPLRLEDPRQTIKSPSWSKKIFGTGYAPGFGNSVSTRPSEVVLPAHRLRAGRRAAKHIQIPRRGLEKHADQLDDLVPIRLDIEWDHVELGKIRLRDTFTWNLHDRHVNARIFAENLVEDFGLPLHSCQPLVRLVVQAMEEQIQDYYPHVFIDEGPADPNLPYIAYKDDELRIVIKLNITIGQHTLVDQFEWDMNNSSEAAEVFARQMAQDEGLSGEFTTAIAHSIREQVQLFTRSLYVLGYHFDGSIVTDEDVKSSLGPSPMPSALRPYQAAKEFTPYFFELNEAELEKTELSQSREERRQKRSVNRRGGPTLPDLKDRQRTIRTLVISSVIPGAAETLEDSRIFKRAPVTSGRVKRSKYAGEGDDSEDDLLESDDSSPEEAIPSHLLAGTARTRGMRGAATVAHAAVRGALGRSATPEAATLHHHETRTSGRRFGGKDYREESVDDTASSLIVKFRIGKERFRRFIQDLTKNKTRPASLDAPAHSTRRSLSATPGQGTPAPGSMGPPTTPSQPPSAQPHQQQSSPEHLRDGQPANPLHPHAAQLGRVEANGPPTAQNPVVFQPFNYTLSPSFSSSVLLS